MNEEVKFWTKLAIIVAIVLSVTEAVVLTISPNNNQTLISDMSEQLNKKLDNVSGSQLNLSSNITGYETILSGLQGTINSLQGTVNSQQSTMSNQQSTITSQLQQIVNLNRNVSSLSKQLIQKYLFTHNPTYNETVDFVSGDHTNNHIYNATTYNCIDFSKDLLHNATLEGIRCLYVVMTLSNGTNITGHNINCFNTTDSGYIFVEPQSDILYNQTVVHIGGTYNSKTIKKLVIIQ